MAYTTNSQARRMYEVLDTVRAGVVLLGTEVKSIRKGKASLEGAQVLLDGTKVLLSNVSIPPYQEKNTPDSYDPLRKRQLLLNRKEIEKLYHTKEAKNLFIIPLSLYASGRNVKLDIGICKKKLGRNKRDERRTRDFERASRRGDV